MNIIPAFIRRRINHRPNLAKIVDNMGWLFFDKVLRIGVGLIVGVWVARYFGPEQFGLFNYVLAFVGLFGVVAALGLQNIVVRDIVRDPSCKGETLGTAALLQLAAGLLSYICLLGILFWLRPEEALTKLLVAVLGSVMLFKASELAVYWFESQVMSKYIVWVQNGSFLAFAIIKVLLILNQGTLISLAWATMAEGFIASFLMLAIFSVKGFPLQQLRASLARAKSLLADSWPLLLSGIAITAYMKIDQIMLGLMLGDEAVGIYSVAIRISEAWYFVPMIIAGSVFPSILEAKRCDEALYQKRLQYLYDLMVWLSIAIALPITFLSTQIITGLFGLAYSEAGPVLVIHVWASVFVFLGVASGQWFMAENRQILIFQRTVFGAVINVALNYIFIPRFGVIGAAYATVMAQACVGLLYDLFQKETRPMFVMKLKSFNLMRIKTYRTQ